MTMPLKVSRSIYQGDRPRYRQSVYFNKTHKSIISCKTLIKLAYMFLIFNYSLILNSEAQFALLTNETKTSSTYMPPCKICTTLRNASS